MDGTSESVEETVSKLVETAEAEEDSSIDIHYPDDDKGVFLIEIEDEGLFPKTQGRAAVFCSTPFAI